MVTTLPNATLTREAFEQFAALPENQHRRLEFINGEVVEMVSNEVPGHITALLGGFVTVHVAQHNLGYTTSAETGFRIGANDYIPDLAFIAASQRPHPLGETWITVVPDLVLEVKSPTDTYIGLVRKAADYVAAGVRVVWVVLPDKRRVEVYTADDHLSVSEGGVLDGGAVLPGFTFKVADLFAKLR